MKNWKSMLFALLIFAALFSMEAKAQAPALNAEEVALLIRDSDNAHNVAKAALDAVGCLISAPQNDWTPEDCMNVLRPIIADYGQEHMLLHPRVLNMILRKMEQRSS